MTNPLLELKALGQSVWLDDIDRGQLRSGAFGRLIERGWSHRRNRQSHHF